MSRDFNVWMRHAHGADRVVEDLDLKRNEIGSFSREGRSWILHVSIDPCEAEDVPDAVFPLIPGAAYLATITLEPRGAPKSALALARKLAGALAEAGEGCLEDPEAGRVTLSKSAKARAEAVEELPRKAARPGFLARLLGKGAAQSENHTRISELELSWWMDHDRLAGRDLMQRYLALLSRHLPEALPRRYGPYEPPAFTFADTGVDHFIDFLEDEFFAVVYPTRPCTKASYPAGADRAGWVSQGQRREYKAVKASLGFNAEVLDNADWRDRLATAFGAISEVLQPFYGEARILGGRLNGRNSLSHDAQSEEHPVWGPWWAGIPREPAAARVIGPLYLPHWSPDGERSPSGLVLLRSADWRRPEAAVNAVPGAIAQPEHLEADARRGTVNPSPKENSYPEVFPFPDTEA